MHAPDPAPRPTRVIDLRSDTLTCPDDEMRRAMAEAEVGDDVYGEDPTARRLEERAAELVGHEAALFVPTGTMGNQIALHLHGAPGSEVICDRVSHIIQYEHGAMAALSGLLPRTLDAEDGFLTPEAVEAAVNPEAIFKSRSRVLALEDTVNMAGGRVYPRERTEALLAVARRHGLRVHLDGARIVNAAVAQGLAVEVLARGFDSVMFCLSKGLGAPVGSLLCGSRELMGEARRVRKMLGGGMRQVGVLAAAGLVALARGPERLAADHQRASWLARELAGLPGLEIVPERVETNILVFGVRPEVLTAWGEPPEPATGRAAVFLQRMAEAGVLGIPASRHEVRLSTYYGVGQSEVEEAASRIARLVMKAA